MAKGALLISVQDNLSVMGLRFIHESLLAGGHRSSLLFLPYFDPDDSRAVERLKGFVFTTDPAFIGISLMSIEYDRAAALSDLLKGSFPSLPIVWGGAHPTVAPETCFVHADYVCLGEGEQTACELVSRLERGLDCRGIPNICCREKDDIRRIELYPLIEDLDKLPHLGYVSEGSFMQKRSGAIAGIDGTIYQKEARYMGRLYEIIASRGCAFACSYCCNNFFSKMHGTRKIRRRSVGDIVSELSEAVEDAPWISLVHIQDDSFLSASERYIEEFSKAYRERIGRPLMAHAIPIYINHRKLGLLKEAGLTWINMGLQSGSDRVLTEVYHRNSLRNHFLEAASTIHRLGIAGKYDVIVDNPFESEDETIQTVETVMEIPKPCLLEVYSLRFFPGTELYERAAGHLPGQLEGYRKKTYLQAGKGALNSMVALAVNLPKPFMRTLVRIYRKAGRSILMSAALAVGRFLSAVIFRPLTLVRVYLIAHRHSFSRAVLDIPIYMKEMLVKNF